MAGHDTKNSPDTTSSPAAQFAGTQNPLGEHSFWTQLEQLYTRASDATGQTALINGPVRGAFEFFMQNVRSMFSPVTDASVMSMVRDTYSAGLSAMDFVRGAEGDTAWSAAFEKKFEEYMAGRPKPQKFGHYDIYMAAGWKPEGPIMINGKMVDKPEPIKNLLAVYIRHPNGQVEILDPSQKMESLTDFGALLSAMYSEPKTDADKRWQDNAGTFMQWQIYPLIPMLLTGGATLVGKVPSVAAKSSQLYGIAEKTAAFQKLSSIKHGSLVTGTTAALGTIGIGANAGDVKNMVEGLTGKYFSNRETQNLAEGLSNLLASNNALDAQRLRNGLNTILQEYSVRDGVNIKQIYIASIKEGESPYKRLQELMYGRVAGSEKPSTPWDAWKKNDKINIGEVQDAIRKNPKFQLTALKIAERFLTGKELSDQDMFVMRIAINADKSNMLPLFNKDGNINFSEAENKSLRERIKGWVSQNAYDYAILNPETAKEKFGVSVDKSATFAQIVIQRLGVMYDDKTLQSFIDLAQKDIKQKMSREITPAQAFTNSRPLTFN